jgi:glyceraldehyde-3-phosphate dehydrogenase (NADP+)
VLTDDPTTLPATRLAGRTEVAMRALAAVERWAPWVGGRAEPDPRREADLRRSPYDDRPLGTVELAADDDVECALAGADAAWREHRRRPAHERAAWLREAADELTRHSDDLVGAVVDLIGKPVAAARVEVGRGPQLLRLAAEELARFHGDNLALGGVPGGDDRWGLTRREPIGVVAAITPFNAPVNLFLQKVAPALAVGDAVVAKPAPEAAIVALQLAEILSSAVPAGLVNVVPGGADLAVRLASDPRVGVVSLTGGVAAGTAVSAAAGPKPVLLELGSNAANIVCADADLDDAAARIATAAFGAGGQQCISAQRVIVDHAVFEPFLERFSRAAAALVVGDPRDPATDIGPLVHARRRAAVEGMVDDALARGASLVLDGRSDGPCLGPTIVVGAPREALVWCDEIFGPVAVVVPAESVDHAVEQANDSPFGLQSACFTRDLDTALRVAEDLRSGSVWINDSTRFRLDTYPFGGYGLSGVGREGVRYAMEALSHLKFVGVRRSR